MVTLRPTSTSSVSAVANPAATGFGFLRADSGTSLIMSSGGLLLAMAKPSVPGRSRLGHLAMLLGEHGVGHQTGERDAQFVGKPRDHAGIAAFHGFEPGARHVGGVRLVFL